MSHPIRKFPGDFAGAFIPRIGAGGIVEVLVIGALPIEFREADAAVQVQKLQIKMPGGCAVNPEENGNLALAIQRELHDEIAGSDDFQLVVGDEIFQISKPGRSPEEPPHKKAFYHVGFRGDLRLEDVVEDEGDEILAPPFWLEARELLKVIFFTHRDPLIAGLERLARTSAEIAYQYSDILAAANRSRRA